MGSSFIPSRSKGKQLAVNFEESDVEPEGIYQHTRTFTSTITPIDYNLLVRGIDVNDEHSAIVES